MTWPFGTLRPLSYRVILVDPPWQYVMHTMMEALYDGPYCELFGREQRPGWAVWGNETDKFTTEPLMTPGEHHDHA